MICPECNGIGTAIYYRETDRDENSVTVQKFEDICHTCHGSGCKPQTNADRIRAVSDEELAKYLWESCWDCHECSEYERLGGYPLFSRGHCDEKCEQHCLDWLKQPVKDGEDE